MKRIILISIIIAITLSSHAITRQELMKLNLPLITIETVDREEPTCDIVEHPPGENGTGITNATKVPGRMVITLLNDTIYDSLDYAEGISGMRIKIRGNTSATSKKKPYKLDLEKKVDLLFRGNEKKYKDDEWVLIKDPFPLNLYIGMNISSLVDMKWTPAFRYVNVIMNDTYRGVYALMESVKRNSSCRIDINKEDGYISELDAYWWNEPFYIATKSNYKFTFKHPKVENFTEELQLHFTNWINGFEDALVSGGYSKYIDVESFASWLLVHDIYGNRDPAGSNIFITKQDSKTNSKLTMSNVWDLDWNYWTPEYKGEKEWALIHNSYYWKKLFRSPDKTFVKTYKQKWNSIKSRIEKEVIEKAEEFLNSPEGLAFVQSLPYDPSKPTAPSKTLALAKEWFPTHIEWLDNNINALGEEDENGKALRVLCIGNSLTTDALDSYVWTLGREKGYNLVVGNAFLTAVGLDKAWEYACTEAPNFQLRKVLNGKMNITDSITLKTILENEPWDIVFFQQNSQQSGLKDSYEPYLSQMIQYVRDNSENPYLRLGFHMTWAYEDKSSWAGYGAYEFSQTKMYDAIIECAKTVMEQHPEFTFLVPSATAVQNIRSSYVGDNINRDPAHLGTAVGRYTVANTWFEAITGEDVTEIDYKPSKIDETTAEVCRLAAHTANESPFTPTDLADIGYAYWNDIIPAAEIQLNFGAIPGPADWNNITTTFTQPLTTYIKDAEGEPTGILLRYNDIFVSTNEGGAKTTNTIMNMPEEVSKSCLWGYTKKTFSTFAVQPTGGFKFIHLNKDLTYDFTIYSSRINCADNRETEFIIDGEEKLSATLNAANNYDNTITISNVKPHTDGSLQLTVKPGSSNDNEFGFYYLNAISISVNYDTGIEEVKKTAHEDTIYTIDGIKTDYTRCKVGHIYITPSGKKFIK